MKIKVIIPNSGMDRDTLDDREKMLSKALSKDTIISVDCIKSGPDSIESNSDEALAVFEVIKEVIQAEKDGFDAVIVYCFSDLGIDAARENVAIPVIGPGEITLSIAGIISNRFCVVTTTSKNISRTYRRLMKNNIAKEKMTSVRALSIPVVELRDNPEITRKYLENLCEKAIENENIDTLILGCLGMAQYGDRIESKYNVKILDPSFIAVNFAEMCARLNLKQSERSYPKYDKGNIYGLF